MVLWKTIYTIHRRQREWGKKLSRATLPDMIKAYSLLYRLDVICFKSKSSVSKHLFTNLFGKNQNKTKHPNKQKPIKNSPQNPTSSSSPLRRPGFTATGLLWYRNSGDTGDHSTGVGSLLAHAHSRVRRARGSGSTELTSQGTEPVSQCFSVGWVLRNLQEEPLAAANIPTSQNTCWKFLWELVTILLLSCWATSVKWSLCCSILNKS